MSTNGDGGHRVELPAGGQISLVDADEVDLWEKSAGRYLEDYGFQKQNDLVLLGALLMQQLVLFRAQQEVADPETRDKAQAQNRINKSTEQIQATEKALGVDKRSREQGGQHNVAAYVELLKRAAHAKGVRLQERVKEVEQLMMDMRWQIRLLRNGDAEDRRHHGVSETQIVNELERRIEEIVDRDKRWARDTGSLFVGRL